MTLAAWLHTLSPFILRFSENAGIRWYGVAYLSGFAFAYFILLRLARKGRVGIPAERVGDAMMWLIMGVLIGGRLGFVLFYEPHKLWTFTSSAPFWDVLAIHHGGMASHGGMLGVVVAGWRISRGWPTQDGRIVGVTSVWHLLDIAAIISPFGLFFGRIANFINGELLGKIQTPPGVEGPWWTVQFPQEILTRHAPVYTDAQQQALDSLAAQYIVPGVETRFADLYVKLVEHASENAAALKPLLASRHPSQLFQAAAEGLVVGVLVWIAWTRSKIAGVTGGVFLIAYGVLRIATEFSRLPDAEFANGRPLGLSRGQWLSVAMIIAGLAVLAWVLKKKPRPPSLAETLAPR